MPLDLVEFLEARLSEEPTDDPKSAADVAAKRALIQFGDNLFCTCWDLVSRGEGMPTDPEDRTHQLPHHYDCTCYYIAQELAQVYAKHPDYKENWRPRP